MRRLVLVALCTLWWLGASGPAVAHSVSGAGASNLKTTFAGLDPGVQGLSMDVVENGSRIELTNITDEPAIVVGYNGEPYLRVEVDGVFENRLSTATHLNEDRFTTDITVPAEAREAGADAEPEWERVGDGPTARWHDHRIHWMGAADPPAARRAPDQRHVIEPQWVIPVRYDGRTLEATGQLIWIPGPSPWPWFALAAVLLAATAAVAVSRWWKPGVAALTAVLVAVDMMHAAGVGFFAAGALATQIGQTLGGSYLSVIGWVAGIAGVVLLLRGREDGLYAAAFAGVFIGLNGGFADITDLSRSQVPFVWAPNLARLAIAIALGVGLGLVVGAFLQLRRPAPAEPIVT